MSEPGRKFNAQSARIVVEAMSLLRTKLPKHLTYHTYSHTEDVLSEALQFAAEDGLDLRSQELLAIGAAFHDMGFIDRDDDNEQLGANYALEAMRRHGGYTQAEMDAVQTMILDTTVRVSETGFGQAPTSKLSQYLCDADMSNLGRTDFFERGELRRPELGSPPKREFLMEVKKFLAGHSWHTPAAKRLRQKQKEANCIELERRLSSL